MTPRKSAPHLYDQHTSLYQEDFFRHLLSLERKRTERTRKPFLLMKLHVRKLLANDSSIDATKNIARVLSKATREIDVKGWFEYGSKIGVIFTETSVEDKELLKQKVLDGLHALPGQVPGGKVRITFRSFPADADITGEDNPAHAVFYPEATRHSAPQRVSIFFKRAIDIIGSIVALIFFSPFFLAIPIAIKWTSKGPALFKQKRLGQFGKKFTFLKFRSMYVNNDPRIHQEYVAKLIREQKASSLEEGKDGPKKLYKIKDDPRITPIGGFLRKSSLDELPQFFNVLKGEMSLVGPRPPIPYEIENYDIWHKRRVLTVKPGITGLWQINGRSSTTFDEMVRLDIQYVLEWSLWMDIKILFKTVYVVFTGKGGY